MSKGLLKMAEGYELLAAGLREMVNEEKPAKKEKKASEKDAEQTQPTEITEKKITVEMVRAVMADKSREGKTQEVRQLLNEFGVDKLSAIPEEKLADLLKKAEVL